MRWLKHLGSALVAMAISLVALRVLRPPRRTLADEAAKLARKDAEKAERNAEARLASERVRATAETELLDRTHLEQVKHETSRSSLGDYLRRRNRERH